MPQIFGPGANTMARVSLVALIALPGLALATGSAITRSSFNTKVGVPVDQPVPFSHMHHVSELGIDCRYCHNSVEKSATAGLPATSVCMSCHSQIWTNSPLLEPVRKAAASNKPIQWTLVNSVPDFVYFNHSIHVAKGVGCNTCHGPVGEMMSTFKGNSFQMAWCLDCHRKPEQFIRPRNQVFNMNYVPPTNQLELGAKLLKLHDIKKGQLDDCSICHR